MTGTGIRVRIIAAAAIVLLFGAYPALAQTHDPAFEQLKSYLFGRDATALDKITAMVQHARAIPAERAAVAADLASVLTSSAAFDAKQFACRQLVFVGGEPEVPALARLLTDDKLCHYALMALAKIPGKSVNDAVFSRVNTAKGNNRVEMLCLLADRRDNRAEDGLIDVLRDENKTMGRAAISALSVIPDESGRIADDITGGTPVTDYGDTDFLDGYVQLGYRERAKGNLKDAETLFRSVTDNLVIRAADLRGLVLTSSDPVPLIVKALGEDGTPRQNMAAEIVSEVPGAAATRAFAAALLKLTARGQYLLLTALGNRRDKAAAAGVMALSQSNNPTVRLAALKTLGQVGDGAAISVLLNAAATGGGQVRETARQSLARLHDDRVDKTLSAILSSGGDRHVSSSSEPAVIKVEAITALGSRRAVGAIPEVMVAAADKSSVVSSAAFAVLRDIAPPPELPAILTLTLSLAPDSRDEAVEAAAAIAGRGSTEAQRTGPLLAALRSAKISADKLTLLTILDQVGGPAAVRSLENAVSDRVPAVSEGALSLLAEWPTDEPMDLLLRIIRAPGEARRKNIAMRGYLKMIGANDQRSPDAMLALYREASGIATRADDTRQILSGLAKLHTLAALEFASSLQIRPELKPETESALVSIGRSTIGAFPKETRAALEPIANEGTDDATRKLAAEALALPAKAGDFIIAWEVSPAYHQDGVDYTHLFDMPFPPETADADKKTPWQLMPVVTNPQQPWLLDLLALWGGEQRVAYLRTAIGTDEPRDLTLELGSDDGVKAWLNGKVILADNTQRGVTPGQEKVKVHLNAGWNTLMLKITQNVLGWGACARFTGLDGSPVTGLRYTVPSTIK